MGKHIKTQMDYDMIEKFAKEIQQLDPSNGGGFSIIMRTWTTLKDRS